MDRHLATQLLLLLLLIPFDVTIAATRCDVIDEPDVKYFDIRIPEVEVPPKETTYVCQMFQVPADRTYHAVAFQPLIVNHDVMHHLLLFGCDSDVMDFGPHRCGAADRKCSSWLAQWTLGVEGQICAHPGTGVRFGKDSFRFMALQIHWNNALRMRNLTDSSGIRVYYTDRLRLHDAANVQTGQHDLELPPLSSEILQSGSCSSRCTRERLPHPVYLTRTYLHMHFLGSRGELSVIRDGRVVSVVARDDQYHYELSPIHTHDPPVEVRPGDELRLQCWFDTLTGDKRRNTTVHFGEGSSAEMCYAFVTYFPRVPTFDQCVQNGDLDICSPQDAAGLEQCRVSEVREWFWTQAAPVIDQACLGLQSNSTTDLHIDCKGRCAGALERIMARPCMEPPFRQRVLTPASHGKPRVRALLQEWERGCHERAP